MATLKESAMGYVPPQNKTVADLEKLPVEVELLDGEGINKENEPFKYKYIKIEGEEYRIAGSVIGQIKAILEAQPNTKFVQVLKSGSGLSTRYQVIPYLEDGALEPITEEEVGE